jgi:phenylalanine-4-hydroxylase
MFGKRNMMGEIASTQNF